MVANVSAVVEGALDEAVLQRIAEHIGFTLGTVYGRRGKHPLLATLSGYNDAARFSPWVALIDLDRDYDCAPSALAAWIPQPSAQMFCRIPVRAIESWLLADRERVAALLAIPQNRLPDEPDTLPDPMRYLVDLARTSDRAEIRTALVPRRGSGRSVGPRYNMTLIDFVTNSSWRIDEAIVRSPSLRRTIERLEVLGD